MAITTRKLLDGSDVYWVSFRWRGRQMWERAGKDRRLAERLEAKRKKEVKAGVYVPLEKGAVASPLAFGEWAEEWANSRADKRNSDNDTRAIMTHLGPIDWLWSMPLSDLRPMHMDRMIEELRARATKATGKPLSDKSIANMYGLVRTMLRRARRNELIAHDPCELERGTFDRQSGTTREPYDRDDVRKLLTSTAVQVSARVWIAIAFFTGMREGEICGRRWRDYDRGTAPLGTLLVRSQYVDQVLKTERKAGTRTRKVPVHPALAAVLDAWWSEGFESVYCRKPTREDFIVPVQPRGEKVLKAHTKSSAYKMWLRACKASGVTNQTLHATRHTFVSFARRGGADKSVVSKITHNAKGDTLDGYTHYDWAPLCDAVMRFGVYLGVDSVAERPVSWVETPGIEVGPLHGRPESSSGTIGLLPSSDDEDGPPKPIGSSRSAADVDASQQNARRDGVVATPRKMPGAGFPLAHATGVLSGLLSARRARVESRIGGAA